jgi:hypothetical protein
MSRPAFALCLAFLVPLSAAAGAGAFDSLDAFARTVGMKTGGWQTRVKVTAAEIGPSPAADPAALAEVRANIEKRTGLVEVKEECSGLSPEGRPRLPGILLEPQCSPSRLRAGDGRWSLSCVLSKDDQTESLSSEGTYSRKRVIGRHEAEFTYKGVIIHVKAETESRWTGKCRPESPIVYGPVTVKR